MKWITTAAALVFVTINCSQAASPFSARRLENVCTHLPNKDAGDINKVGDDLCGSYFMGVTDAIWAMQEELENNGAPCTPTAHPVDIERAKQVFSEFLRQYPQYAGNSAGLIAPMALIRAYPCSK